MSQTWTVKLLADGEDGLLLLNDEMLNALGAQIGDEVDVSVVDGAIVIAPLRP